MMNDILRGQVALVTGGGRGIGRAIAIALASEGMQTAICARTEADLRVTAAEIERRGGVALVSQVDVTNEASVRELTHHVETTLGPIDLLVNNAGTAEATGIFHLVPAAVWWHQIEVNLGGPINCTRAVLPGMLERRSGRIINLISAASFQPRRGQTAYCAGKSALEAFTEHLATETSPLGVHLFSLSPGFVHTAMVDELIKRAIAETAERMVVNLKQGRTVPAERAAKIVVKLAKGKADRLSGRFFDATENFEDVVARTEEVIERDLYVVRDRR